ncbi:hypothetical protein ACFLQY_01030 [Verrucomicrobiota bacterium]
MKKSILMAMSASILLTGCLVKKSDYEAEQAAHEATRLELVKVSAELASASAKFEANVLELNNVKGELPPLRLELSKSRAALISAQQEVEKLKAESSMSSKRATELASQLAVAEKKVADAKELFTQRLLELKMQAEAGLAEVNAKNEQLRRFMLANFSSANFNAASASAEEASAVVVVKKSTSAVAAEAPAEGTDK